MSSSNRPLISAIIAGHYGLVTRLIANGEKINGVDPTSGHTALTALIHHGSGNDGHIDCLNQLISLGADVNERYK